MEKRVGLTNLSIIPMRNFKTQIVRKYRSPECYFLLPILIQIINSVNKPFYIEDQPNLALFLNSVKPGIALSETVLSGEPPYNKILQSQSLSKIPLQHGCIIETDMTY